MKENIKSIIIATAILLGVFILANTYRHRNEANDIINVTGLAKRDFMADLIVWKGEFSRTRMNLKEAYAALKQDQDTIRQYLIKKGVKAEEMVFSAIDIDNQYDYHYDEDGNRHKEFAGYRLGQGIEIESRDVEGIERIAREVSELINKGVYFFSSDPEYYYTQLSELKIEMLASAADDARLRAETIVEHSGGRIGKLRYAKMGIFQIIAQNSNESYSWGGAFNTSSKRKTATVTMKLQYGLE